MYLIPPDKRLGLQKAQAARLALAGASAPAAAVRWLKKALHLVCQEKGIWDGIAFRDLFIETVLSKKFGFDEKAVMKTKVKCRPVLEESLKSEMGETYCYGTTFCALWMQAQIRSRIMGLAEIWQLGVMIHLDKEGGIWDGDKLGCLNHVMVEGEGPFCAPWIESCRCRVSSDLEAMAKSIGGDLVITGDCDFAQKLRRKLGLEAPDSALSLRIVTESQKATGGFVEEIKKRAEAWKQYEVCQDITESALFAHLERLYPLLGDRNKVYARRYQWHLQRPETFIPYESSAVIDSSAPSAKKGVTSPSTEKEAKKDAPLTAPAEKGVKTPSAEKEAKKTSAEKESVKSLGSSSGKLTVTIWCDEEEQEGQDQQSGKGRMSQESLVDKPATEWLTRAALVVCKHKGIWQGDTIRNMWYEYLTSENLSFDENALMKAKVDCGPALQASLARRWGDTICYGEWMFATLMQGFLETESIGTKDLLHIELMILLDREGGMWDGDKLGVVLNELARNDEGFCAPRFDGCRYRCSDVLRDRAEHACGNLILTGNSEFANDLRRQLGAPKPSDELAMEAKTQTEMYLARYPNDDEAMKKRAQVWSASQARKKELDTRIYNILEAIYLGGDRRGQACAVSSAARPASPSMAGIHYTEKASL